MSELIRREDLENWLRTECYGTDTYDDKEYVIGRLRKELPTITASPWHRVEEELPEIGKAVVVSIYGDMWVATRLDDKRFNGRMYWELSDGSWERVENDMYWMPIEPPQEDNDG